MCISMFTHWKINAYRFLTESQADLAALFGRDGQLFSLRGGVFWKMYEWNLQLQSCDEILFKALVGYTACRKLHPLQLFASMMKTFRCQLKMFVCCR